ncbi:glycosyltransferase family 2 protein [Mycobacterium sp. NPDC003449]
MTAAPTVSVITITRDDLGGLRRTVASVRAQRYAGRIEHIVIDGGSGADVVDYLARNQVGFAYWQSRPDGGRYDAMNQGIAHASGDLLWFLHSSDRFADADAVSEVVRVLARHGRVDTLWGYGIEHEIGPDGRSAGFQAPIPFDMRKFLTLRATIPHQAAFFGSSLVKELGRYDLDFTIAADQLFMLRAALLREPVTIGRVLADFDTTGAGSVRPARDCFRDMRRMWDAVDRYPVRGRRTSTAYLRCWEYLARTKLAAARAAGFLKVRTIPGLGWQ